MNSFRETVCYKKEIRQKRRKSPGYSLYIVRPFTLWLCNKFQLSLKPRLPGAKKTWLTGENHTVRTLHQQNVRKSGAWACRHFLRDKLLVEVIHIQTMQHQTRSCQLLWQLKLKIDRCQGGTRFGEFFATIGLYNCPWNSYHPAIFHTCSSWHNWEPAEGAATSATDEKSENVTNILAERSFSPQNSLS